ncbi:hypothetical protein SL055_001412 [Flavobacterium psychrophilum]|nr:hypothetical protein [Flavobacterium psychrophilum]
MYQYQNNILSIPAKLLYCDWGLMSYKNYNVMCFRKKLIRTKEGRGKDNEAWVSYHDLPRDIKAVAKEKLGEPKDTIVVNKLLNYMVPDATAINFFASHRKPDGTSLSDEKQREKATNCIILNAIQTVLKSKAGVFGKQKTKIWENISISVNNLPVYNKEDPQNGGWLFSLPGHEVRLKQKYNEYLKDGYKTFIHKGEGTENSTKLKGEVADFILAKYQLPNKPTVTDVLRDYETARGDNPTWPSLSEQGVGRWLNEPAQERIWILARDGKDAWRRKFGNAIERSKDNWFPNVYWAIDGSKLDLVYYEDTAGNKMEAKQKINVLFDIYSEKIIGYSLSETENHFDHIAAVNMGMQEAQVRPYLMTYDNQSGHKMKRMQELYGNVIAKTGGTHYAHKVGQKSSPVEQFFFRLQTEVISKFWFSDKQSVKARLSRNQMNAEFIKENKHNLPTKAEIPKIWEYIVKTWNNAEHPRFKGQTRCQVYNHEMPMQEELSLLDIVSTVWVAESTERTYYRDGIKLKIGKDEYKFEVYEDNTDIDLEFRRLNVGNKFIIRYSPEYLNDYVQLYKLDDNKQLQLVAYAQPKRAHENIPVLMKEGDNAQRIKDFDTQEIEYQRDKKASESVAKRTGITREALIQDQALMVKMGGHATKKERNEVESAYADLLN